MKKVVFESLRSFINEGAPAPPPPPAPRPAQPAPVAKPGTPPPPPTAAANAQRLMNLEIQKVEAALMNMKKIAAGLAPKAPVAAKPAVAPPPPPPPPKK